MAIISVYFINIFMVDDNGNVAHVWGCVKHPPLILVSDITQSIGAVISLVISKGYIS